MYCNTNKFREKMDSGQLCLGPGITFADPSVSESIAPTADFVWVDLEHNPTNLQTMMGHLIAARAAGTEFPELCDRIAALAAERIARRNLPTG